MNDFENSYQRVLSSLGPNRSSSITENEIDPHHLDCLINASKYAPIWNISPCSCTTETTASCVSACIFNALGKDAGGNVFIDPQKCTGCSACIQVCKSGALTGSRDILTLLNAIKHAKGPVFAMIAPAFVGQFSAGITPGKLRSAFKKVGFTGLVEVALFADILTLKEALEFDKMVKNKEDYMITSCCCPIWISMIRKLYTQFMPHVPGSVSPMIACGRCIKHLYPNAVTVFIGPCLAKKAEAREPDISDAVDVVLTFQEIRDIFNAFEINPGEESDDFREHTSKAGRIYARAGGVSEAICSTVQRLRPDRVISIKACQADGPQGCKELLLKLKEGQLDENFLEGMGCPGGCVGGPRAIVPEDQGKDHVNQYAKNSLYETPLENPFVIDMLSRLGFKTPDSIAEDSKFFIRHF